MSYFGNDPTQIQPNGMNLYGGYPGGYPPDYYGYQPQIQTNQGYGYVVDPINNIMNAPVGGVTTIQGGFNPVNGVTTYPQQMQGVPQIQPQLHQNPYQTYAVGTPGYMTYGTNPYYNNGNGYMTPYGNPNGAYVPGIPQNQYNAQYIEELLYTSNPNTTEFVKEGFRTTILSQEEMDKYRRAHSQQFFGYDYYGRPIFTNGYGYYNNGYYDENRRKQEELEKARKDITDLGVEFSRAVHTYFGDDFDENEATVYYDPYKRPIETEIPTPEEIEYRNKAQNFYRLANMSYYIDNYAKQVEQMNEQKARYYDMIKASHDKLLGIEPGKPYGLKEFLENGYKLMINIAKQKAVDQMRNGQNKYDSGIYRQGMAAATNMPIPMPSTIDDEYVPVEAKIRDMYSRNKFEALKNKVIALPDGNFTLAPPPKEILEENARKDKFMNAVTEMATADQAKRGWGA